MLSNRNLIILTVFTVILCQSVYALNLAHDEAPLYAWVAGRHQTVNSCAHIVKNDLATVFHWKHGKILIDSCNGARQRSCQYTLSGPTGLTFKLGACSIKINSNPACTDDPAQSYIDILSTTDRLDLLSDRINFYQGPNIKFSTSNKK
jgi:hypothetical protein